MVNVAKAEYSNIIRSYGHNERRYKVTVKERILTIRLTEKLRCHPEYIPYVLASDEATNITDSARESNIEIFYDHKKKGEHHE